LRLRLVLKARSYCEYWRRGGARKVCRTHWSTHVRPTDDRVPPQYRTHCRGSHCLQTAWLPWLPWWHVRVPVFDLEHVRDDRVRRQRLDEILLRLLRTPTATGTALRTTVEAVATSGGGGAVKRRISHQKGRGLHIAVPATHTTHGTPCATYHWETYAQHRSQYNHRSIAPTTSIGCAAYTLMK
jgi:hypothetical protein